MASLPQKITFQVSEGKEKDGVPVSKLIAQLKGLLRLLIDLDIQMSEDQRKTARWVISEASYNSPLTVTLAQRPIRGREVNPKVPREFVRSMRLLEKSTVEPPNFTPTMMLTAKKVLETTSRGGGDLTISGPGGTKVRPTKKLIRHVDTILQSKYYKEYTTIEGKLLTLDIHGPYQFIVYDPLTDHGTSCRFDPDLYDTAYGALGRRVAVTGMATYNRQDEPTSLAVDEIHVFDDPSGLPRFMPGEEINITGDLNSEEYVRRARDVK